MAYPDERRDDMLDDETDEAVEPTAEDTSADAEGADDASAEDAETADAVDAQASPGGAGETVLKQPEVPDDANDKIAAAQEHINSLNMDEERDAAERAAKQL
jgi:hypothetical protein